MRTVTVIGGSDTPKSMKIDSNRGMMKYKMNPTIPWMMNRRPRM